ncbi:MAG: thioredoxin family protein [Weeksellaceae bacterium]
MLKKTLLLLLFLPFLVGAQILTPVKWSTETKDLGNNEFEVMLHAKLDAGWHMYSQQHPDDGIGIPATLEFEKSKDYELIGKTVEIGKLLDAYSELFMQQEKFYENKVTFKQKIKVKSDKPVEVKFSSETQVCDAEKCLAPDWQEFKVKLTPSKVEDKKEEESTAVVEKEEDLALTESEIDSANLATVVMDEIQDSTKVASTIETSEIPDENEKSSGLWGIFLLGVSGGLLALVMPCIFPMIPLTVSLFTKQSKGISKALIYGLSIVAIFIVLATFATLVFGPSALNEFSTNPWVNIAFFAIFIFFAISFFGAFELTLPASWANYTDKQADKGGYLGIFFMAFTLVIISFSCTLPIIGSLAAQAATTGKYYALIVGSLGFSVTLAIPFVLFAIFPSWISSLPKSGGWMNTVKVSLGFIELAFAFKFLSNADLVWQAHWLERETFLAIWIAVFGLMGIYLLGKFRLPLDSKEDSIGVPRLFFAILTFSFVIYMIPGMWGAPVKLLSGLTPPIQYAESPNGVGKASVGFASSDSSGGLKKGQEYGPHQIPSFRDLEDAFAYAKEVNKPLLIDFTGHACANCRKVEEKVWSNPKVKESLMNDVVLVSLYVDERTELPIEEQIYSETLGRNLKTVGNKWTVFQIEKYQNNAQPYYIIVDEHLNNYNEPMGAMYEIDGYLKWMNEGIDSWKAKNN